MSPRQKRRTKIGESFISYPRSMLESPALRVLSHMATRVMHRIEIEHLAHGGAENGKLIVTYDQLVEWGVDRKAIAPAIRELTALGFLGIYRNRPCWSCRRPAKRPIPAHLRQPKKP